MKGQTANTIFQSFLEFFRQREIRSSSNFLLAVSGGLDSTVLCELCYRSGFEFTMAHCNFALRGEESEDDEKFVKTLAKKYDREFLIKKFDTEAYASANKLSIQEAARNLRYNWFAELRKQKQFSFILLAHHADDNIETLLMNFFRGTGFQGLTGIPPENRESGLLRPLIDVRRQDILDYALSAGLSWREDSSNASSKYTRNYFRNELIPALNKVYPQANENLLANIRRFESIHQLYEYSVEELKKKISEQAENELRIPIRKLLKYPLALVYEIIRDYGFGEKQVNEVLALTKASSGKFIGNDKYRIIKHRDWLIIATKEHTATTFIIEKEQSEINFPGGSIEIKYWCHDKFSLQKKENVAQLDLRHVEFPLLLRRWKPGDYFYPLGMRKKKKLARFFIDMKLSKNRKENVWVMESNKKIIWVVGLRIDDRFKITDSTKEIISLSLSSPSAADTGARR
ncbi:MAG: tRNA lysidine(34) synthetase TilS [Flavisolibacter sp.]